MATLTNRAKGPVITAGVLSMLVGLAACSAPDDGVGQGANAVDRATGCTDVSLYSPPYSLYS